MSFDEGYRSGASDVLAAMRSELDEARSQSGCMPPEAAASVLGPLALFMDNVNRRLINLNRDKEKTA